MRALPRLHMLKTTITSHLPAVAREARELFHRRKVSYALLAVAVTAGSVYVGASGHPLPAQQGRPTSSGSTQSESGTPTTSSVQSSAGTSNDASGQTPPADSTSPGSSSSSSTDTTVTVNGQQIDVPENGSVHASVPNDSGSSSVDITHTSSGDSNSSISVHVQNDGSEGGVDVESSM